MSFKPPSVTIPLPAWKGLEGQGCDKAVMIGSEGPSPLRLHSAFSTLLFPSLPGRSTVYILSEF